MRKWLILFVVAIPVLIIDQTSKLWVLENLAMGQSIEIINPYINITHISNSGIAFGLLEGRNDLMLGITSIVVLMLLIIYSRLPRLISLQHVAFAMIIGGALGNIIDRFLYGHVVDFVHITIPNLIINVSNFADHFVVIGTILVLVDSFIPPRTDPQQPETSPAPIEQNTA